MHELGIVFYIIKDVKKVAEENDIDEVKVVSLNLGEVSTVIPSALEDIWKWARKKEKCLENCELKLNMIKAISYCEDCKLEFDTIEHGKTCPHCGSEHTYLKQGNEVEIQQIEV